MHIRYVPQGDVCLPSHCWGKWSCSDSAPGSDGYPVVRYLQLDGTWGNTTEYFDSEEQVNAALALGHKPDFTMGENELFWRQSIRDDVETMFDWDAYYDDMPTDYEEYDGYEEYI
jgi:hypothetical protein